MSFQQALDLTVGVEGAYSCIRSDPGNWTGGAVGAGQLLGTMDGISAAFLWGLPPADPAFQAYPQSLKPADIARLYQAYFWTPVAADSLPPSCAGLLFDASVNQGPGWAARCLQAALGVAIDGVIGPQTKGAIARADAATLHAEIARLRDERYRALAEFPVFGVGWLRRLMTVVAATSSFT